MIDEVSTVSDKLMYKISTLLAIAKKPTDPILLFGGVNLIVFRDFMQFPPVPMMGSPLYKSAAHVEVQHKLIDSISEGANQKVAGRALFL